MFRLWFALILVVILGSFTNAENKPTAKASVIAKDFLILK